MNYAVIDRKLTVRSSQTRLLFMIKIFTTVEEGAGEWSFWRLLTR